MKLANRLLALILSVLVLVSSMSVFVNAAAVSDFYDFPWGTWSEEAMTAAVNNDLLHGRGNGLISPKDYITRAEAVAVINRAFGATVKADISGYTDVSKSAWYYNDIAKAVNMQTLVGVSNTKIDPEGYITRESMLTVLARALVLDEGYATSLSRFVDGSNVSAWAKPLVAAMAERGYVNGNEKGELNPRSYITREEFSQVMHNIFHMYIPNSVKIDGGTFNTTIIRAKDVTLNNVTINGDLVVGDGVGNGNLNLTNVIVTGRILFRGGEGKVTLTNTVVGEKVVINDVNGVVNFLNYRVEDPFKNIQENTKATFLNMVVNNSGGGGSSTPSRAEYKIREYFQGIDGTYPSSAKYSDDKKADYGKTITYQETTHRGYTFDPTHPDSILSGVNKGKLVLKAYYARNNYKVSFDGYETELPYEQKINADAGLKAKMQEVEDKNAEAGYDTVFNTKQDGTGKEVKINETTVDAEDLYIYAILSPIEYRISYDLDGGQIIDPTYDRTYDVTKEVTLPANVVKAGYSFGGWYDESGNRVTVIPEGSKGNKTFKAKWNIETYTITYVPGEFGTMDGVSAKTSYTIEDDKYTLPQPIVTKQDYVFKGWYTDAQFTGRPVTVLNPKDAENKIYYALIAERSYEQYTITFDGKTYTVTEGEKIGDAVDSKGNKLGDVMDNVTYPKGYESDDFRIKGDDDTVITKNTIANGDMEIVAAKKAIEYTITFVTNGGNFDNVILKTKYTVEDADYTLPVPVKTDYTFGGWYENADFSGSKVTVLDTASAENKTYYAYWNVVTYDITFNGTKYTVATGEKLGDAVDSKGNKLGNAMDNVTYPDGYEADGFHIKGDKTQVVQKDTIVTGNMEIEAGKKAIVYTITYQLNGGKFGATAKTTYTVEDDTFSLSVPSKDSYRFLGWYEKADFSGSPVSTVKKGSTGNKTFYAKWEYVTPSVTKYTINFDGTDYEVVEGKELSTNDALKDAMDDAKNNAEKGYTVTFNTKADNTGADVTTETIANGDMKIYVIKTLVEYTITYEENGGNTVNDDTYTVKDADITLPVPVRADYVFRGWYEKADFSGKAITVLDTADAENKTYYAKWTLDNAVLSFAHEVVDETVTVKVMLNAIPADIDDIAAMTVRYAYDASMLEYVGTTSNVGNAAASAGYISWYSNANYIDADTLENNGNVLFTITFKKATDAYGTTEISYKNVEIAASKPEGNPTIATKYTKESETIDLGAVAHTYTIKYVVNGGNSIADGSYTVNDPDITLPIPVRDGYAFKGWYENADFIGEKVTVLDTSDAEDKTYYAKWVIETAKLDFSAEKDGSKVTVYVTLDEIPSDIDDIAAFTLHYKHPDNKLTYLSGSTTFGGQFSSQDGYISWYTDGAAITSEELKEKGNIIATLVFVKDDSASGVERFEFTRVELVASKPVINPTIATKYVADSEDVQLDAATYLVAFKGATYNITAGNDLSSNAALVAAMNNAANMTGYFVTFNTEENGSGTDVTFATKPTGPMTIFAVATAIEYNITYEVDGGALDGTQKTAYTVEDADYTLPEPTKAGYNFLGWYENGTKVTVLDTADAENKTYTAKWEATEYTITYVLDGGALDGNQKTSYTVEDADYVLPTPTKDGHNFLGWYEDGTKVTVLDTADAEDKTYYAKWYAEVATLDFASEIDGDNVKIYIILEDIPSDITDIAAFTLKYKHPDKQLTFVKGSSEFAGNFSASDGYISWFSDSKPITADDLSAKDNILATLEFTKKPTASGVETFEYTFTEIVASEPAANPAIAENYKTDIEEVQLGQSTEDEYTITYVTNGGTLDGTQWTSYTTSSVLPYKLPVPVKDAVPFEGWYENEECTGEPVTELALGSTGDKTYYAKWAEYKIQFYLGTAISRNKPTSDDGDRGMMLVEHGATLTQADVDRELGMEPSEYKMQEGYTNSDGVIHEIAPELWYQKDGKWVKFVPEDVEIVSDMNIHLFTRFVALEYTTDLQIKGIDLSKLDFSLTVPYDSKTDIGKTYFDALTNAGITVERVLDGVTDQGYDLYQMAIDAAASKGLVDSDGNIINPNVAIPLHKFITKEFISDEIDAYIDDHIHDDEFIADLISNDHVHAQLIADEGLRERLLTDSKSKNIIKEKILDNKDKTFKEDIKAVLKEDLKENTTDMLEDSQIRGALISAVEKYLAIENITYITAEEVVEEYKNGTLDSQHSELYNDVVDEYNKAFEDKYDSYFDRNFESLMDDHFDSYFEDVVDAYINHTIDSELKKYIDEKLVWYEEKLISDFISGEDRTLLHNAIPDYAEEAVAGIKKTAAYNNPINDFVSGNGVRVNEENLIFIEMLDSIMHKYDYDSLMADVLPSNIKQIVDLVGREVAEEYVNKYLEVFCEDMDQAVASINADLDAGITGTEYKFTTSPKTRVNYMEIMDYYYSGVSAKLRDVINSQSKIPVSSNPYAQRIVDMDYFEMYFDRTGEETEYKSGYKLKDDVMEYYYNNLELEILFHDAVTFYGSIDTYTMEDRLDSASLLVGTYANKLNDTIMNFIENGELPKGYTLDDILNIDARIEGIYNKFEDKILKAEDIYAEYLDKDYTQIIDFANMSIYANGNDHKIYQIILENGEDAFDFDDMITAIFDSPKYIGVSQIENAMAKIESKIKNYSYTPESNIYISYVDAYKATLESKEIKGIETGTHTIALQRYLRYYK